MNCPLKVERMSLPSSTISWCADVGLFTMVVVVGMAMAMETETETVARIHWMVRMGIRNRRSRIVRP